MFIVNKEKYNEKIFIINNEYAISQSGTMVDLIIKLVDAVTSFLLFGTQVAIDREEGQNVAITYFSTDADCLCCRSLIHLARI